MGKGQVRDRQGTGKGLIRTGRDGELDNSILPVLCSFGV